MNEYFGLIKRSFTNSFKKDYYKDWWRVPTSERFVKAGLPSALVTAIIYVIMTTLNNRIAAFALSAFLLVFVFLPYLEKLTEDLISKYKKN